VYEDANYSIASAAGFLKARLTPAADCSFRDFNVNESLGRFGVHSDGAQDASLMNEK